MTATPSTIAATEGKSQPQRLSILSGIMDASVDVRKACNGIKRAASIGAATMLTGLDPKTAVEVAQSMSSEVLLAIGFDVDDEARVGAVMPMILEATCLVLSDAAFRAKGVTLSGESLDTAAKVGVQTLVEVARSRAVAKMVEQSYPSDMDSTVALRLTATAAIAQVAIEIAEFDFAHSPPECIREAGKVVVKAAMEAAEALAPKQASKASRLMLTQSLIQSAAKIYGASWRSVSLDEIYRLDQLSYEKSESSMQEMEKTSLASLLEPVNARFAEAFSAITETAKEVFEPHALVETPSPRRTTASRPR